MIDHIELLRSEIDRVTEYLGRLTIALDVLTASDGLKFPGRDIEVSPPVKRKRGRHIATGHISFMAVEYLRALGRETSLDQIVEHIAKKDGIDISDLKKRQRFRKRVHDAINQTGVVKKFRRGVYGLRTLLPERKAHTMARITNGRAHL